MEEEVIIEKPTTQVLTSDAFDGAETQPSEQAQQPENKPAETSEVPLNNPSITETPVEDGRSFLKEKLGYEDWDSAKAEIEALKIKPAGVRQEPISVEKIKEAYAAIDKQERLTQLTEGEVTESNAPDIIKAAMIEKYKGLKPDQVNYKFNKQFALPPEPKQDEANESDEDFANRREQWQAQVSDVKMDMLIEANLARPELEKLKSEIKLPTIAQTDISERPKTPEELALEQKEVELFMQNADAAVSKFEGFSVTYKDKDVDVQSSYALSAEEKSSVMEKMKVLAEKNYNSNAIFAERWVNADSSFNFSQIAKDLAILETHDKTSQKFASDAYTKAQVNFIKNKHNIDLNGQNGGAGDLQLEDKDAQKKNEDAIWN